MPRKGPATPSRSACLRRHVAEAGCRDEAARQAAATRLEISPHGRVRGELDVSKRTPATMVLEKAGKPFELLQYAYDPDAPSIGLQAADALGLAPSVVFKTLMVVAGEE